MPSIRLRAYLILMATVILVPVIGFYATALHMLEEAKRESTFLQLEEKANSVSLVVQRELLNAEASLRLLSTSVHLQNGNFEGFYQQANAANQSSSIWFGLLDESGRQVINTKFPYGTVLPSPSGVKEKLSRVLAEGKTVVTDVLLGPSSKMLITTLVTPVTLDNGKRYALLAIFSSDHFINLIRSTEISSTWITGILDSQGKFIARTLDSENTVGTISRVSAAQAFRDEKAGVALHKTQEGVDAYSAFRRIPNTTWSVSVAVPEKEINVASHRAAQMAAFGMTAGVLLAVVLAFFFGGRIVRAIQEAQAAAHQLGRREKLELSHSNIKEVDELFISLVEASQQLHHANESKEEAETRATKAGELLQLAVDAAELGTFYCPFPLDKIYWNNTCKRHFFLSEGTDIDFELFYNLIHSDDRERVRKAVENAVFNHETYDAEYRTQAPDGRIRWIRAKGRAYYNLNGQPVRFDGITIDISRNKEVEARLERASQQKDDFLAMLAHELRNPLAPISSAASLLRLAGGDTARVLKSSEVITRQVKHMAGLLDDLLDVSRVTRGIIKLKNGVVDAKSVISAATEQVHPLMQTKSHQLLIELPAEPAFIRGDDKRLIQIIVNLLTNAARYSPTGGNIRLTLETTSSDLLVKIKDDGIGIPPDLIDHMFDLFVQGERTSDRQQGGLGLGLALVKSLTQLHGGEVSVTSDGIGKGSLFIVRLPRYHPPAIPSKDTIELKARGETERQLKITVVDDNPDVANTLGMLLTEIGHQVWVETDPHIAWRESINRTSDVFILDIGMPGLNGHELAASLRNQPETKDALLIAISGYGQEDDLARSAAAGFNHHLMKPVDMQKLLDILRNSP